ncbi:MAG: hypothetical protein ATN32_02500 [Candidatus Epulonipiscium fishelsonii]|nr:MAG: hypothetical protein ATN32_02500 [Epulopiscium sp. AS2M-Bin002]
MLNLVNAIVQLKNQLLNLWSKKSVRFTIIFIVAVFFVGEKGYKSYENILALNFFHKEVVVTEASQVNSNPQATTENVSESNWLNFTPNIKSRKPALNPPGAIEQFAKPLFPSFIIIIGIYIVQKIYLSKKTVPLAVLNYEKDEKE